MCTGAAEGPDRQRDGARGQEEASCRYRHSQVLAESDVHIRNQLIKKSGMIK